MHLERHTGLPKECCPSEKKTKSISTPLVLIGFTGIASPAYFGERHGLFGNQSQGDYRRPTVSVKHNSYRREIQRHTYTQHACIGNVWLSWNTQTKTMQAVREHIFRSWNIYGVVNCFIATSSHNKYIFKQCKDSVEMLP